MPKNYFVARGGLHKEKAGVVHQVIMYVAKDCADPFMSPAQLRKWVLDRFDGSDYGDVLVREITTNVNNKQVANKLFKR